MRVEAGLAAARALARVKMIGASNPGEHELTVIVETPVCAWCDEAEAWHSVPEFASAMARKCPGFEATERRLRLGPVWSFAASGAVVAQLAEFGVVTVVHEDG